MIKMAASFLFVCLLFAFAAEALANEIITYSYDAKGRLIRSERTGTVNNNIKQEYTYDKSGNRTTVKTTGSSNTPP